MDYVSASQNHDTVIPKRRQFLTDAVMLGCPCQGIDAKLKNGNICVGVHVPEYGPGTVVDPPGIIDHDGFFYHTGSQRCSLRGAFRRIFQLVQLIGKTVSIIYHSWRRSIHEPCPGRIPVG